MTPLVTVIKKGGFNFLELRRRLRTIQDSEVFVGIPQDKTPRNGDEMNNATLAHILTNGSPLAHLPARPFLEPGIKKASQLIAKKLGESVSAVIMGEAEKANTALNQAGQAGANSVKRYFTDPDNNWAPNAPSTIAAKGSDRPNIDTAQLKKSITYVVREGGNDTTKKETTTVEKYDGAGKSVSEVV